MSSSEKRQFSGISLLFSTVGLSNRRKAIFVMVHETHPQKKKPRDEDISDTMGVRALAKSESHTTAH